MLTGKLANAAVAKLTSNLMTVIKHRTVTKLLVLTADRTRVLIIIILRAF